jgi:hypothetical protein
MSLLQQDSPEIDDAALGEEFTKGSSHVVWAAAIATVLVTLAIGLYVMAGTKPPAVTGEVERVWAHPMHTETSGIDASGAAVAKEGFDQVLVFTRVKLHNQTDKPVFMHEIMTNAKLDDGIHTSYAAIPIDYERVFQAYPELASLHSNGLSPSATIDAGQTVEGTFVSAFRLTKDQWDARKALDFTLGFQYQPNLTLTPAAPVIEQ